MDIKSLDIENFCAIGEAHLTLDNRGLILIQGVNADDSSAKSNGAGKSSIVDALCWVLYGTTARGETGDAIVNSKAKKDTAVIVEIDDAGTEYKVARYRKHTKHKNQLFAYQYDDGMKAWIDISKGTERETQEVVQKIMGSSLEVFKGSIYAGQEQMPDLPGMTDKHLKLLVEEGAGVEELGEAHAEAQKQTLTVEKELAVAYTVRNNTTLALNEAQDTLNNYIEQEKLFDDGRKDRAKTELTKVPPLQAYLKGLDAKISALPSAPTLTARKTAIEAQLTAHSAEKAEQARLMSVTLAADRRVTAAKTHASNVRANLANAKNALASVEAKIGAPCGECGKAYCEHDVEAVKRLREADIVRLTKDFEASIEEAKKVIAEHTAALTAQAAFEASMTDVSAVSAELAGINAQLRDLAELEHQHKRYSAEIEAVKAAAKTKLTEANPWSAHVPAQRAKVATLDSKLAGDEATVEMLEEKHQLLKDAVAVFGPAGVRAHILDTVTPFLNHQTGEYLGALADGNIHATWSTLTANAKGELKEKFSIAVENDHGGKSFGLQSGGEKRKVRIACALALQDMVASRATKPINIFIADEVDHALDDNGLERLMGVLDRKAKERGTVLVISHNALSDWIDQTITVTKSGGKSTVSGAVAPSF